MAMKTDISLLSFVQRLAHVDEKIRFRALKGLKKFLKERSQNPGRFTYIDGY